LHEQIKGAGIEQDIDPEAETRINSQKENPPRVNRFVLSLGKKGFLKNRLFLQARWLQ
jgi:hypothetical protein